MEHPLILIASEFNKKESHKGGDPQIKAFEIAQIFKVDA